MDKAIIIPMILALTEIVKRFGISSKYAPLVSIVLGVGISFLTSVSINSALEGVVFGLSASGLWSGGKTIISK